MFSEEDAQLASGSGHRSDSGNYVARCNNCVPGGAYPDSAFVHVTAAQLNSSPWAQWEIIVIP